MFITSFSIGQNTVEAYYFGNQYEVGDTVIVKLSITEGVIQWQESLDLISWTDIAGETNDSLIHIALSKKYVRARVIHGVCNPYYSDTLSINVYTLNEDVVEIDTAAASLISDSIMLSQGIYQFNQAIPMQIDTGDIIVSSDGYGYMRKVTDVVTSGNEVILETIQATLEEVIDEMDLVDSIQVLINSSKSAMVNGKPVGVNIKYIHPGVKLSKSGDGLSFDNTVLYSGQVGSATLSATITNGSFKFDPIINQELKISWYNGIEKLRLSAGGATELEIDLELECDWPLSYTDSVLLFTVDIGPAMIGIVPMFISLEFYAGFSTDLEVIGTIGAGFEAAHSLEFGAAYNKFNNPKWNSIWERTGSFTEHPLVWAASADVEAKAYIQSRVGVRIANIAGPYFEAVPYLRLGANVAVPAFNWQYELAGGADANLGFYVGIYGYTVADYNTNLANWDEVFYTNSGTLGNPPPVAHFEANDTIISQSDTISFTDLSINNPVLWQWNFGDGSTSTLQNPTHSYSANGIYSVSLIVSNSYGSDYEEKIDYIDVNSSAIMGQPCPGTPLVTDYDNIQYTTVLIGNQCWMAENLKTIHYTNGTSIPNVTGNTTWAALGNNNTDDAYCYYDNSASNSNTYGALYTWAAVMGDNAVSSNTNPSGVQGVCPTGWHLPSDNEWKELEIYLGMTQAEADNIGYRGATIGSKLAGNSSLWSSGSLILSTPFAISGFEGFSGGQRLWDSGNFASMSYGGYWWSSTSNNSNNAWYRELNYFSSGVYRNNQEKSRGFSVRCVKD